MALDCDAFSSSTQSAKNVNNAVLAIPVGFTCEDLAAAWECIKDAASPRLQVEVPTSTVQMEYIHHVKAEKMIVKIEELVKAAKALIEEEEKAALAEKLFVTRQTVSNYETGKSRPDVEMLTRIAEVLETDVSTLIYGPKPPIQNSQLRSLIIGAVLAGTAWVVFLILSPINV